MTKNPSDTWFYNDWENDPELKTCSLAAQGLWMRLLCIAARSPERGVVQIGDLACSLPDGLAHIALSVGRPLEEIAPLMDELLSSRAASLDRKKRVTNRRMKREAKTSKARSKSGKNGANVTNGKRWRKTILGQQNVGKPVSKTSPSSLSSSLPSSSPPVTTSPTVRENGHARAFPIGKDWDPKPETVAELRRQRPDLVGEVYEAELIEFRLWCRANAVSSHDPEATFMKFMRRAKGPNRDTRETFDQRRIREARAAVAAVRIP